MGNKFKNAVLNKAPKPDLSKVSKDQQNKPADPKKLALTDAKTSITKTTGGLKLKSNALNIAKSKLSGANPLPQSSASESGATEISAVSPTEAVAKADPQLPADATASPPKEITADEYRHETQPETFDQDVIDEVKASLEIIDDSLTEGIDKTLINDAMSNVLKHMLDHPFLEDVISDEDCGLMVRALKETFGTLIAKKTAAKGKRAASAAEKQSALDDMTELGIKL